MLRQKCFCVLRRDWGEGDREEIDILCWSLRTVTKTSTNVKTVQCTYVSIGHCKTNMQIISTPRIYCTSKKSGTKGRLGVGSEGNEGGGIWLG